MTAAGWACQQSVDVDVPVSFAWRYMTDIRNWNDPPAEFTLEGPFEEGSRGTTLLPAGRPILWTIRRVDAGRAYTIDASSSLERAELLVHWRFDPLSDKKTRLTQRIELFGDNAGAYVDQISAAFEPHLEAGMRRVADLMMRAASEDRHG
jgi:hypothetical protein